MKSWNLYRNTSPKNYFNKNNNYSLNVNNSNLPEKYFVKYRFRNFDYSPVDHGEDHVATVRILNRHLTRNEYVEADQLHIETDVCSADVTDNLTGQFITPVSEVIISDESDDELDHNSRLDARHRICEEYLQCLEKRYSVK
ncbi:unnamed protein product [Heterobilharzia americana]|nr:unnamed protein product [Heterobilharzia americana]